jgi:hypothetical protein
LGRIVEKDQPIIFEGEPWSGIGKESGPEHAKTLAHESRRALLLPFSNAGPVRERK